MIKYQEATEEDAYGFEYVAAISWKNTYWELLSQERLENRVKRLNCNEELKIKLDSLKEYIKNNPGKVFVAKDNDKVIGILEISEKSQYDGYGYLKSLYVLPEYKGKKIGKELFTLALEKLIELGNDKMQLECMCGNKTINFYFKYGGYELEKVKANIYNEEVDVSIILFDDIKTLHEELSKTRVYKC